MGHDRRENVYPWVHRDSHRCALAFSEASMAALNTVTVEQRVQQTVELVRQASRSSYQPAEFPPSPTQLASDRSCRLAGVPGSASSELVASGETNITIGNSLRGDHQDEFAQLLGATSDCTYCLIGLLTTHSYSGCMLAEPYTPRPTHGPNYPSRHSRTSRMYVLFCSYCGLFRRPRSNLLPCGQTN